VTSVQPVSQEGAELFFRGVGMPLPQPSLEEPASENAEFERLLQALGSGHPAKTQDVELVVGPRLWI
jgi:hypothetical protein